MYLKNILASAFPTESSTPQHKPCCLFQHFGCKYRNWAIGLTSVQVFNKLTFHEGVT